MIRQLLRSRTGTAVVEFAVVLPMLLFLLMGLMELGRYGYLAMLCAHAARAGTAYGQQNVSTAADQVGITNAALHDVGTTGWTVVISHNCQENNSTVSCAGQPVSGETYYLVVKVTGTFHSMFNYPGIPSVIYPSSTSATRLASQ